MGSTKVGPWDTKLRKLLVGDTSVILEDPSVGEILFHVDDVEIMSLTVDGLQLFDSGPRISGIIDDDTMATATDTTLSTSESIKAYVDASLAPHLTDKIYEGDSYIEVVDAGTGELDFVIDGAQKGTWVSAGLTVVGTVTCDGLVLGQLESVYMSSGGLIYGEDDAIWLTNLAASETLATFYQNGAVALYYDNTKEFETISGGIRAINGLQISSSGIKTGFTGDAAQIATASPPGGGGLNLARWDGSNNVQSSTSGITDAELEELSDGSLTTLHDHDVTGLTNWPTIDYSYVTSNDGATDVTAAELEQLTDNSDASLLHTHKLNYITNPDGDKTFAMTTRTLKFLWTAPTGNPMELEASGAYTGAVLHIHQHTGNPGAGYLLEIEAEDTDIEHIKTTGALSTTHVLCAYVTGDTEERFVLHSSGLMEWGAGGVTALDVNLYRSAADILKTDDNFQAAGGLDATVIGANTAAAITGTLIEATTSYTIGGMVITDNIITTDPGDVVYLKDTDGDIMASFASNGASTLYHNNVAHIQTKSDGARIYGDSGLYTMQIKPYATQCFINSDEPGSDIILTVRNVADTDDENAAVFVADGGVILYYDDVITLSTTAAGATLVGVLTSDGLTIGDAEIIQLGSDGQLLGTSGKVYLKNGAGTETMALFTPNGSVTLYYDNNVVFQTASGGANVFPDSGSNVFLQLYNAVPTLVGYFGSIAGTLYIQNSSAGDGIYIRVRNGADSGNENAIVIAADGAVTLYHDSSAKFSTSLTGATLTGTLIADGLAIGDNEYISLGTTALIYGDGSYLHLKNSAGTESMAAFAPNGAVTLYYDNTACFETIAFVDGGGIYFGGYTNQYDCALTNYTGNLGITNRIAGGDIYIYTDGAGDNKIGILVEDDGPVNLYYNGTLTFRTSYNGVDIFDDDGLDVSLTGAATANLQIVNNTDNSYILLRGYVSGSPKNMLVAYPHSFVTLYYAGVQTAQTSPNGLDIFDPDGDNPVLRFYEDDLTTQSGRVCWISDIMYIDQYLANDVTVRTGISTSAETAIYIANGGGVSLYNQSNLRFTTTATGCQITGTTGLGTSISAQYATQLYLYNAQAAATTNYNYVYLSGNDSAGGMQMATFVAHFTDITHATVTGQLTLQCYYNGTNMAVFQCTGFNMNHYCNNSAVARTISTGWGPFTHQGHDLGSATVEWQDCYLTNSPTVSSDRRLKKYIKDSELGLDFIMNLRPVSFLFKDKTVKDQSYVDPEENDGVQDMITERKIKHQRRHYGMIAQEVAEALFNCGIETSDFAGYVMADKDDPDSKLSLRYEEFISPMIKAIQDQQKMIEDLQQKVEELSA